MIAHHQHDFIRTRMVRRPTQKRYLLANQILDIIREGRFEPGHHLREQQLADLLGISRSPIRTALALLAERGIIEARRNQGYFLRANAGEIQHVDISVPSTPEQDLYSEIVQERLNGDLPESFTQSSISRRYDVDRALLQRTLLRLVDDGLLRRNQGRGWTFLPTLDTGVALQNSYEFRRMFEPASMMGEHFRIDPGALEHCRIQHIYLESHPDISRVSAVQIFDTDAQFHEMIARFTHNAFIVQTMQQHNRLRRLLEFGGYVNRRRVRDWCREHLRIMDALSNGRNEDASTMMAEHLGRAYEAAKAMARGARKEHPQD
ncbi:GntR family transcriptional regulator [Komagataeibacter sp. SM21]|uniref:GntR family transcriptional regulator n=1 Tax=Komagataeibacter sp. SM21 TaxID=3242899 RepID=UPI003528BF9A